MGTWIVKTSGDPDEEPIIIIDAWPNAVRIHMPSDDPVEVTPRKVDEIRLALLAANSEAQADQSTPDGHRGDSPGGEDRD